MSDDEPKPTPLEAAFLWIATISVPLVIGAVITAALVYGLWLFSHFNIQ